MAQGQAAALSNHFSDLLDRFTVEVRRTDWGQRLPVADAADRRDVADWLADVWPRFQTAFQDDEAMEVAMSGAAVSAPEPLEPRLLGTDAGVASTVILVWLMFLAMRFAHNGGRLPPLDGDMWCRDDKAMADDQFFSNPALPERDDVLRICTGVRAALPAGWALPPSALAVLQTAK